MAVCNVTHLSRVDVGASLVYIRVVGPHFLVGDARSFSNGRAVATFLHDDSVGAVLPHKAEAKNLPKIRLSNATLSANK